MTQFQLYESIMSGYFHKLGFVCAENSRRTTGYNFLFRLASAARVQCAARKRSQGGKAVAQESGVPPWLL
eukprot:3579972-Amphidinium_carterae.1